MQSGHVLPHVETVSTESSTLTKGIQKYPRALGLHTQSLTNQGHRFGPGGNRILARTKARLKKSKNYLRMYPVQKTLRC